MVLNNFTKAIQVVLDNEGGYVNNPNDPGGATNFGISQRSFPNLDIKNLTRQQAIEIYLNNYWNPQNYSNINDQNVATKVFDFAVNAGPLTSNKLLQQACNTLGTSPALKIDGNLGPASIKAINSLDSDNLLATFRTELVDYYTGLCNKNPKFNIFLKGWLKRAHE
jgi:lysozyme family protein